MSRTRSLPSIRQGMPEVPPSPPRITPGSVQAERHILENGLELLFLPRRHLPIVSLTMLVRSGVFQEGPQEAGLAAFTGSLLTRGTERRDAETLAEDIDVLGANLGIHTDYDFSMGGISCLARRFPEALEILAEVVTRPALAAEEVERRRNDILSHLEQKKDDPVELVRNRFIRRIYGEHPYHHPRDGTRETIERITGPALRSFHERFYRPDRCIFALVGDLDVEQALDGISAHLGSWAPGPAAAPEPPVLPAAPSFEVERIQKDGVTQATLRVGSLGIRRNSPDYVPLVLLNYILGGAGFGSRLMMRLREKEGLTYGAYSNFHPRLEQGYFFASCQTALTNMTEALAGMLDEIGRLRRDGVSEEELEWGRRFYTGSLPLTLETNDQLAARILEREFFHLPESFWLADIDRMRSVTVKEVNEAARRYLHPETFTVVCLADYRKADLDEAQIRAHLADS